MTIPRLSGKPARFLALSLVVCAVIVLAAAWFYYQQQLYTVDSATLNQLAAIAAFKSEQIANWRKERVGDGRVLAVPALMTSYRRFLSEREPRQVDAAEIIAMMDKLSHEFSYTDGMLVDLTGSVRIRLHQDRFTNDSPRKLLYQELSREAIRAHDVVLSDLALTPPAGRPLMMLVVPVMDSGALILEIDPNVFLYPYLRSWPTATQTAESLLIRREADSALALSPLRDVPDGELVVRRKWSPAIPDEDQLSKGWFRKSRDYRGVPILGVARHVPDSPWYLSVKIDRAEAEAPLGRLAWELTLIALLIIVANGAGIGLVWRGHQLQVLREREAWFRTVANDTPAYLWMWTPMAENSFINAPLAKFLGTEHDKLGTDWIARVHPEDLERARSQYLECVANRREFKAEFRVRRSDGQYRWVVSTGIPRFGKDGESLGYAGSMVDVTERKEAEAQLREANSALVDELRDRTRAEEEVHALSARLIQLQEEERSRLARDLHDNLSQTIAALSIGVSNVKRKLPSESPALGECDRIQQRLAHLAQSMRQLSHQLHPSVLEHAGLIPALQSYCRELADLTSHRVLFRAESAFNHFSPEASLCVYRVAQEALQNSIKHSGVKEAEVVLSTKNGLLTLTVSDQGVGIAGATTGRGLGLVSIKERARLVNGTIEVRSSPGEGVTIELQVPTSEAAEVP